MKIRIFNAAPHLRVCLLTVLLATSTILQAQYYVTTSLNRSFKVSGQLNEKKPTSEIYLYNNGKKYKGKIEGNEFVVKGSFERPGLFSLRYVYMDGDKTGIDSLAFFLAPGTTKVKIADPVADSKVESFFNDRYKLLSKFMDSATIQMQELYKRKEGFVKDAARDSVRLADSAIVKFSRRINSVLSVFFLNKGHWIMGGYGLQKYMDLYGKHFGDRKEAQTAQSIMRIASNDIFLLPEAEDLYDYFTTVHLSEPGNVLPSFYVMDATGYKTPLQDYKGKYVLLQVLPADGKGLPDDKSFLARLSDQYRDKELKVFELALNADENPERWIDEFKKNNSWWLRRPVQKLRKLVEEIYSDNTHLRNVLLDKEGKIIAKNLSPTEIEWKLEELVAK